MRLQTSLWNEFWLLLFAVIAAACSPPSPAPQAIAVPLPEAISELTVSVKGREQSKKIIQDRSVIERVTKLVSENNSGWSKSAFTFPTPSASAVLSAPNGTVPIVIWFGPDWLGVAVDGEQGNYFWHVRPEVEFELRRLLEINA